MRRRKHNRLTCIFWVILSTSFLAQNLQAEEECLKDAWRTFNSAKYDSAIFFADKCIDEFGKAAQREQARLDSLRVPLPPTQKVSDVEKNRIFNRGLLNDVATAYYIKGRSAEYLYRRGGPRSSEYRQMAIDAYNGACQLKHGRTWDPKGWFWSPCEVASDRLSSTVDVKKR